MANSSLDPGDDLTDEERQQARLAAMQRALDATPTGSEMTPTGSTEHTPGGQELLGHEGGPNLGDYYKFANDLSGTKPEFIGDTLGRAANTAVGAVSSALAGTGTAAPGRPNPLTDGTLAASVQSPDAFERNAPITTQPLPTTTSMTTPPVIPPGPTTATTTTAPRSTTTTQPVTTTTLPTTQPKSTTTTGPTTTGPTTTQNGPTTGTTTGPQGPTSGPISNQNTGPADNQGGQGSGSLGDITSQVMSQIQTIGQSLAAPGTPSDVTGVFLTQAKSILAMLDDQEAQLRAESEKNGTMIDPSTAFTIDKIRETLADNIRSTREDLNRRGLSDSGIELELENKLTKGSASDQAQILATRLTNLQQQLASGLQGIRTQKVNTLTSFGKGAAEAQTTHDENQYKSADERERAALTAMLGLRSQVNESNISSANNSSAMQRALLEQQGQNSRAASGYQNATDLANLNNTAAMQRALASARSGSSSTNTPTQINNPYGGNTPLTKSTNTGAPAVNAQATNAAINALSSYPDRTSAENGIANSLDQMTAAGVDPQALSDALDALHPPSQEEVKGRRTVGGSI